MFGTSAHPEMDRAFNHVLGNSVLEPVTPSRWVIYLLIRTIDKFHRCKDTEFTYMEHIQAATLVQLLLSRASLTFEEMTELVEKYLPEKVWILDDSGEEQLSLLEAWKARIHAHRNYPVTVRREDVLRPGRESDPPTITDAGPFVYQHSTIGTFVRRLSLACARQTETEIFNTHQAFLEWTRQSPDSTPYTPSSGEGGSSDQPSEPPIQEKGTARRMLFGGEATAQSEGDLDQSVSMDISMDVEGSESSESDNDKSNLASNPATPASLRKSPSFLHHTKLTPHLGKLAIAGSPLKRDQSTVKSGNILTAAAGTSQKGERHIASPYSKLNPPKHFEFLSSSRIRDLILKQLHCLQVAPSEAMPSEELQMVCSYIKNNYTDLPSVHLLQALDEIRRKRVSEAESCLRLFFDWNMIRLNESGFAPLGKIGRMDVMPLRYAPLLLARLCRVFGQKERAQHLLYEAVQQAEADKDQLCMRLCLIEQAALEMLPQQRVEQGHESTPKEDADNYRFAPVMIDGEFQHTTVSNQTTLSLLTFDDSGFVEFSGGRPEGTGGHVAPFPIPSGPMGAATSLATGGGSSTSQSSPNPQPIPQTAEQIDNRAFHLQLNHLLSLMKCIDCAKKCINFNLVNICLERLIYADYGTGRETQARLISDCAHAVISTLQLGSGLTTAAAATSEHLLNLNQGDMHCSKFDTESQVIAGVNNAYVLCAEGKFATALKVVERLKQRFDDSLNWITAQHWKIAAVLIKFDQNFFKGNLREAERCLRVMWNYCPDEAALRGSVMVASRGHLDKALDMIDKRIEETKESSDFMLKIRFDMVRSQILLFVKGEDQKAVIRSALMEALKLVEEKKLFNLVAVIARRLAYVEASCGNLNEALAYLNKATSMRIETNTAVLERCLYEMACAYCNIQVFRREKDKYDDAKKQKEAKTVFNHVSRARLLSFKIDCIFLEKQAVQMAVEMYDILGLQQQKMHCIGLFTELHQKCATNIYWWLL
ncbi:hypothetical protein QR680_013185 [Steinernema hermaphroditum]|uniref:Anaphase-promoting complex subunit 5 n=1 Tax=Steinernema hermaphroditum TaxID=289476 RepID=A0AA39I788_9BILA|nr:hypothetical protein QR680_013185 [Steinernema hermaphroditum]